MRLSLVSILFILLIATPPYGRAAESGIPSPDLQLEALPLSKVAWGRNNLRFRYRNDRAASESLALRVRTLYSGSVSGVIWEVTYPILLPPRQSGDFRIDFFVRPDHGRLKVELEAMGSEAVLLKESREFPFEAPYRGETVLQPSYISPNGLEWEGRIYPSFKVRESPSFIIYYFPGSEVEKDLERIIPQREKILERLGKDFEVRLPGKSILFFYPDAEAARKLTGHRADGWTYGRTIVEVYGSRRKIDPYHELVHLVAGGIGMPPVLLAEGLATSHEKDFDNAGKYRADVTDWCRGFLREGALIPLAELMDYTSFGEDLTRPRIAYPEAACFTRYLIEAHGWKKFRVAYAALVNSPRAEDQERNLTRFEEIFGMSLRQAESAWKEQLSVSRGAKLPREVVKRVAREEAVPYLVVRGRALLTSGSEEEAEKVLKEAVALDEASLEAHFWLGQAYHVLKRLPAALGEYETVIRLGNRTQVTSIAWSHVWAGQILDQDGKREEALAHYRAAEALHDRSEVKLEGRMTTSLEAAREGIARPFTPAQPPEE
jgi:tetratricopeptide repeat protein